MSKTIPTSIPYFAVRSSCAEKNDRLNWKAGSSWQLGDIVMGLRCNDPDELPLLESLLPDWGQRVDLMEVGWLASHWKGLESSRKGNKNYHIVYQNWTRTSRTLDLQQSHLEFQRLVLEFLLNSGKPIARVFLPGVALRAPQGKTVALVREDGGPVGIPGSLPAGWGVVSYEYVVLGGQGGLFPLPLRRDPGPCVGAECGPLAIPDWFLLSSELSQVQPITVGELVIRLLPWTRGLSSTPGHMYTLAEVLARSTARRVPSNVATADLLHQLPGDN